MSIQGKLTWRTRAKGLDETRIVSKSVLGEAAPATWVETKEAWVSHQPESRGRTDAKLKRMRWFFATERTRGFADEGIVRYGRRVAGKEKFSFEEGRWGARRKRKRKRKEEIQRSEMNKREYEAQI